MESISSFPALFDNIFEKYPAAYLKWNEVYENLKKNIEN